MTGIDMKITRVTDESSGMFKEIVVTMLMVMIMVLLMKSKIAEDHRGYLWFPGRS